MSAALARMNAGLGRFGRMATGAYGALAGLERGVGRARHAVQGFGTSASIGITAPVAGMAFQLGRAADFMMSTRVGMRAFMGDAALGEKTFGRLRDYAAETVYDVREVMGAARTMMAMGVGRKGGDKFFDSLNMIGDLVAMSGQPGAWQRIAVNLGQIKAMGRAYGMDIRQFAMMGLPIMEALGKATGRTVKGKGGDFGEFNYDDIMKALSWMHKEYGAEGLAKKLTATPGGAFNKIMERLFFAQGDVGESLWKATKPEKWMKALVGEDGTDNRGWLGGIAHSVSEWTKANEELTLTIAKFAGGLALLGPIALVLAPLLLVLQTLFFGAKVVAGIVVGFSAMSAAAVAFAPAIGATILALAAFASVVWTLQKLTEKETLAKLADARKDYYEGLTTWANLKGTFGGVATIDNAEARLGLTPKKKIDGRTLEEWGMKPRSVETINAARAAAGIDMRIIVVDGKVHSVKATEENLPGGIQTSMALENQGA